MKKIEIEVSLCTGVNHTARVQGQVCVASQPALKAVPPHFPPFNEQKYR